MKMRTSNKDLAKEAKMWDDGILKPTAFGWTDAPEAVIGLAKYSIIKANIKFLSGQEGGRKIILKTLNYMPLIKFNKEYLTVVIKFDSIPNGQILESANIGMSINAYNKICNLKEFDLCEGTRIVAKAIIKEQ